MREVIREVIAAVQHEIWSHWMKHLFNTGYLASYGDFVIAASDVRRWKRQMNTPYSELAEKEKDSDREQADKVMKKLLYAIDNEFDESVLYKLREFFIGN